MPLHRAIWPARPRTNRTHQPAISVKRHKCRAPAVYAVDCAFTLIEIAISLGVIGFALVAIIGVLPMAMNVQKENRQETVINQDATIFLDLIRNGALGADDLTNYVFAITNFSTTYGGARGGSQTHVYGYGQQGSSVDGQPMVPTFPLTNGAHIIGLLTTPKYTNGPIGNRIYTSNYVVAYVRSMSGPASEKFPQSNPDMRDLGFNYRMVPEICPFAYFEPDWTNFTFYTNSAVASDWQWRSNRWMLSRNDVQNSYDLRLIFRWPLYPNGDTGPKRQVFRTVVSGMLLATNDPTYVANGITMSNLYFLQPRSYLKAP